MTINFKLGKFVAGLATSLLLSATGPASAADDEAVLRSTQAEQFAAMFEDPDNLELMFKYAVTSIKLKDFEAAISTLERILIYNPRLSNVKLELGASYFRLGSFAISKHYFEEVVADQNASAQQKERANSFLDALVQRSSRHQTRGSLTVSAIFSDNANNGPDDTAFIFNNVVGNINQDDTSQADFGGSASLTLTHIYDLDSPDNDLWITEGAAFGQRYTDTANGSIDAFIIRSGPSYLIGDSETGGRFRVFGEYSHARVDNNPLQSTYGVGMTYQQPINDDLSAFSNAKFFWRDNTIGGAEELDGGNVELSAGGRYRVDDATTVGFRTFGAFDGARTENEKSFKGGVGLNATFKYDSGLELAARDWQLRLNADTSYKAFGSNSTEDANKIRQDVEFNIGLQHTAHLINNLAIVGAARYKYRDSNIDNFDLDSINLSLGMRYSF
ncbi:MAG: tetratricopeptide repeat protein [Pikeienuella sp.]